MERLKYGFRSRVAARLSGLPGAFLLSLLVAELTTLHYALCAPFRNSEAPAEARILSMHGGGYRTGFTAIMVIGVLELVGMHLLLEYLASSRIAWIVTGLSAYGMLFLVADFGALLRRPAMIYQEVLYLYIGLRWRGEFPLASIDFVETVDYRNEAAGEDARELDLAVMGDANLRVAFTAEQEIHGPFGIRRRCRSIRLTVDDPTGAQRELSLPLS